VTGQVTGNREYRAPQRRGWTLCRWTGSPAGLSWYHAPDGARAMKALLLRRLGSLESLAEPLERADMPDPIPGPGEVLIRVSACGVCHTELDEIEGRTPPLVLPVIPGHQVVGRVVQCGPSVLRQKYDDKIGPRWPGFHRPSWSRRTVWARRSSVRRSA
jgi:NADPH:quinone reductase-like Zn-dependent oxidoreductase